MHSIELLLAGIAQGITEFLPISSDGHLALLQFLLPNLNMTLGRVVILHAATLAATVVVLRREIGQLWHETMGGDLQALKSFTVACVPTAIIGIGLEPFVEHLSRNMVVVGVGFLVSAGALFSTRGAMGTLRFPGLWQAAVIGVAQGLAVLPGVSRSGMTIASALILGLSPAHAFQFSFILSLPAIAGAVALEGLKGGFAELQTGDLMAAGAAFVFGVASLHVLRQILSQSRVWLFAFYLAWIGFVCMFLSAYGSSTPT